MAASSVPSRKCFLTIIIRKIPMSDFQSLTKWKVFSVCQEKEISGGLDLYDLIES